MVVFESTSPVDISNSPPARFYHLMLQQNLEYPVLLPEALYMHGRVKYFAFLWSMNSGIKFNDSLFGIAVNIVGYASLMITAHAQPL